ncbi:MAG: hypothetical protein EBY17_18165 [Acidobacteriia bacterium]|nr:hypothetical protein [Terriglobia bacterium]
MQRLSLQENPDPTMQNPAKSGRGLQIYRSRKGGLLMVFSMLIVCLVFLRLRRLRLKIDFKF